MVLALQVLGPQLPHGTETNWRSGDIQMLNLSADWLSIFLPHVLQKINRALAALDVGIRQPRPCAAVARVSP